MDYKVTLKTGEVFYMKEATFDAQAITNAINAGQLIVLNLSGAIVSVTGIDSMIPFEAPDNLEGGGAE